jgi:hypothetical protein
MHSNYLNDQRKDITMYEYVFYCLLLHPTYGLLKNNDIVGHFEEDNYRPVNQLRTTEVEKAIAEVGGVLEHYAYRKKNILVG